jgi:hypothetical protein
MESERAPLIAEHASAAGPSSEVAAAASHHQHPDYPKWFTPPRLLALFCGVSLLVYLDRGALSSNGVNGSPRTAEDPQGEGIQGDMDLNNFQDGLLPAAFMVRMPCPPISFSLRHFISSACV